MSPDFNFEPCPLLKNCHRQTIFASFLNFHRAPPTCRRLIRLPDEDAIALEVTTPPNWKETDPTVVMIHGLCGSHKSAYLIRMTKKLYRLGVRAIRLNMRGCGSGRGLAKKMYHSGSSDDVRIVLETLKNETPHSSFGLIGFSLGGNIALKLAGELGDRGIGLIEHVIAVSPPVDVLTSVKLLGMAQNRIYERYFLKYLRADVLFRHRFFEDLPPIKLPSPFTMYAFDEQYLAPQHGFTSAIEYYKAASAQSLLPDAKMPCDILFAKDDPIIDHQVLDNVLLPENISIYKTEKGGHLGFLGRPRRSGGFHWMDSLLLKWMSKTLFLEDSCDDLEATG